jgi:hypothetical protein
MPCSIKQDIGASFLYLELKSNQINWIWVRSLISFQQWTMLFAKACLHVIKNVC